MEVAPRRHVTAGEAETGRLGAHSWRLGARQNQQQNQQNQPPSSLLLLPLPLFSCSASPASLLLTKGVITRRMTAIEEMAGMDILYSDKTGTLTLNRLTVDRSLIEAPCYCRGGRNWAPGRPLLAPRRPAEPAAEPAEPAPFLSSLAPPSSLLLLSFTSFSSSHKGIVIATGVHSFFGKAAHLVDSTEVTGHFKKGVITRRMTAIEEMAGMDILYSDKTGTLTLNRLTVDRSLIEWSKRNREVCLANRWGDWNDEVELGRVDGRDWVQKRREAVEEAGVMRILVPKMVNPTKEERQERITESEKNESCLDEEGLCLDEKCLKWSQNGKGCHGPQEELGQN
ncbi:plasma membrane ATPase 4 [Olea europaea subsp. europaea]|uniref:Plasma membrane ATPase 4 n=1 Tax=Olea europaea subsp. europaea TaxID=158383 RepID=A0A8S0R1F6_OLEEU|nr:plasma membrane ATPase 4 [Olea europaea subsp. europaea]